MRRKRLPSEKHLNATQNDGGEEEEQRRQHQVESVREKQQSGKFSCEIVTTLKIIDHHRLPHGTVSDRLAASWQKQTKCKEEVD